MSRKFASSTLTGNWHEDRAPQMAFGIYPDHGYRERVTSSKLDYARPLKRQTQVNRGGPRFGMVTAETFAEAQYSYGNPEADIQVGAQFDAVIQRDKERPPEAQWDTTNRTDFGGSGKPTHFERLAERSANMKPAGGIGAFIDPKSKDVEIPKRTGLIGERFKTDGDATIQTVPQRAWVPWGDAGLRTMAEKQNKPTSQSYNEDQLPSQLAATSLQITGVSAKNGGRIEAPHGVPGGRTAAWRAPGRKQIITVNDVEASRRPGKNIWADE